MFVLQTYWELEARIGTKMKLVFSTFELRNNFGVFCTYYFPKSTITIRASLKTRPLPSLKHRILIEHFHVWCKIKNIRSIDFLFQFHSFLFVLRVHAHEIWRHSDRCRYCTLKTKIWALKTCNENAYHSGSKRLHDTQDPKVVPLPRLWVRLKVF